MRYILLFLAFWLAGCAAQTYQVPPGRIAVVQFVETEQQVTDLYFRFQPADRNKYKQIRGFYMEGFKTIVVAANPCDPDVLSHELMHFLGQHQVDEDLN